MNDCPLTCEVYSIHQRSAHYHSGILEILLPLCGSLRVKKADRFLILEKNTFTLINSGIVHSLEAVEPETIVLSLHLTLSCFHHIHPELEQVFFANPEEFPGKETSLHRRSNRNFCRQLRLIWQDNARNDTLQQSLHTDDLLRLALNAYQIIYFWGSGMTYRELETQQRYYHILGYIRSHISEHITVQQILDQEYISRSYFSQFWTHVGSRSFQETVRYERMMQAERLLLENNCPISELGSQCGIADSKSFYRLFRSIFGMSPAQWRKQELLRLSDNLLLLSPEEQSALRGTGTTVDTEPDTPVFRAIHTLRQASGSALSGCLCEITPYGGNTTEPSENSPWAGIAILSDLARTNGVQLLLRLRAADLRTTQVHEEFLDAIQLLSGKNGILEVRKYHILLEFEDEVSFHAAQNLRNVLSKRFGIPNIHISLSFC